MVQVSKYLINIELLEDCVLPLYKGFTLRGAFGSVFKKSVCVSGKRDCSDCLLRYKCAYSYIFETPVPEDSDRMRLYPYAPHPFVIEPPIDTKKYYRTGEHLSFNLAIFGKAIDYLAYFVFTFINMGQVGLGKDKARFKIIDIINCGTGDEVINFEEERMKEHSAKKIDLSGKGKTFDNELSLRFLTPLRIKYKGRFVDDLEFHIILRNLLRRISSICYFHCGKELAIDFKKIISESEYVKKISDESEWINYRRYSSRQNESMLLGGVRGTLRFKGDINSFSSFLQLGEYLHVGKSTAFGFGKYVIEE